MNNHSKMKAVIIGHVCIDKNLVEKSIYESAGSPAVFITRIFNQFPDVKTTIVANHGKDFAKHINSIKILPSIPAYDSTLIYNNISKDGKRVQHAFNRDFSSPVKINNEVKSILQTADILLIAPLLPNFSHKYIKSIINLVPKKCLKILSPQGYFRDFDVSNKVIFREFKEVDEISPFFDFIILSDEDYPNIVAHAPKWIKYEKTKIIITLAEKGAVLISEKDIQTYPTKAVKDIVDSTGSGDVFTASFAYRYFQTKDLDKSINFAHKIAGYCLKFTLDKIKIDPKLLKQ